MTTLITGAFGRVGTALIDHLSDVHDFEYFDLADHPELPTTVGDVAEYPALGSAAEGVDSIVHLAAAANVDATWPEVLESNVVGGFNCFEAARHNQVDSVVFASTNHVVGMYEEDHAPDLYEPDYDLLLDKHVPTRPDSCYAVSKVFGESIGRYFAENHDHPKRVYVLRLGSVRWPPDDHPYADAERKVESGEIERGSSEYQREVNRLKGTWLSRRDAAALIESCLSDDSVTFDTFYGTSDNERGWLDIDHAKSVLGYEPRDSGEEWRGPPSERTTSDGDFST